MCRDAKYLVQDPFLNSGTPTYLAFFGFSVPFHVFSTMTPSLGKKHEKLAPKFSEVVSPSPLMIGQCWLCTPCWCLEVSSSSSRWCSMLRLMLCQPHFQGDKPVELRWNIWALLDYWNCNKDWFSNQIVRWKACEPWSRLDANNVTRALRKTINIIRTRTIRTRSILTCFLVYNNRDKK